MTIWKPTVTPTITVRFPVNRTDLRNDKYSRNDEVYYSHPAQQMRTLCFRPVVTSIFFFLSFLSSPNLSRHRLDVYHTSAHSVALVRIEDAGLKRAALGSVKIQDAKNRKKFAICAPSHNFVGLDLCN